MNTEQLLYLSRADVQGLALPMSVIIDLMRGFFIEKANGSPELPPKTGIFPRKNAFINAMPAYLPKTQAAGLKWVAAFPDNHKNGLPYINGLIILSSPETGLPLAVIDGTWITAKRTAAVTALAAKHLAKENSSQVGILGCGVQGASNIEALSTCFKIQKIFAYDKQPQAAETFAQKMSKRLSVPIEVVDTAQKAVSKSDIIVTCGPISKNPQPEIKPDWLKEGLFAATVDFDCYWTVEALAKVHKLVVDHHTQYEYYMANGFVRSKAAPYAELGQVVVNSIPARENPQEIIVSMNFGSAGYDIALAHRIYQLALEKGIGSFWPL